MSSLKQRIPNFLTLGNLLFGCWAIVAASQSNFEQVGLSIAFCLIFDFLDGSAARWLGAHSEVGKELDSLADMVSFGVAPALALYFYWEPYQLHTAFGFPLEFLAFLIPLIAASRLAKFNTKKGSDHYFDGMPTPAYAMAAFAIPLSAGQSLPMNLSMTSPWFVLLFCVAGSLLMISPIKFYSLKLSNSIKWLRNLRLASLAFFVLLLFLFKFFGLFLCLLAYLIISLTIQTRLQKI